MSLQQQFVGDSTSGQSVESIKDLLLPGSRTRTYWEMLIAALLLVQFVLSPYVAAFLLFPRRPFLHAWTSSLVFRFVVDSAADLLYIVDICVRFRTYHFSHSQKDEMGLTSFIHNDIIPTDHMVCIEKNDLGLGLERE